MSGESKYHPFLESVPDGEDGEQQGPDLDGLVQAMETARNFSTTVSEADQRYSEAAVVAVRLTLLGNHIMDGVAQAHGITPENAPNGEYAKQALALATPEELAATFQALNQGYDLALYAFLEAYTLIHHGILSNPMVEIELAGMGTLKRVDTPQAQRRITLMTQLQSPREKERSKLLAEGLSQIERQRVDGASAEELGVATRALFDRVQAAVKDLPTSYADEEEDATHG